MTDGEAPAPGSHASSDHGRGVEAMFDRIAQRYDVMDTLMVLGQKRRWHALVAARANPQPGQRILDLATGTGDIARALVARCPGAHVIGADFSAQMLKVAEAKPGGDQIEWVSADAMALPFGDAEFDAVTHGYLLRNVDSIPTALAEQFRVLRPGGRVVALDTAPPPRSPVRPFTLAYMKYVVPTLGRVVAKDPDAYGYLPETTRNFKTPQEVSDLLREAGFEDVGHQAFMFGTNVVYWARKPR